MVVVVVVRLGTCASATSVLVSVYEPVVMSVLWYENRDEE